MKKNIEVATKIHNRLVIIEKSYIPNVNALFIMTICAKGNIARATYWTANGKTVIGKNVPLNKNMGVIKRKLG